MKTPLNEADLKQLIKLMGMLGSNHDGEIVAAGRAATKFLRARNLNWAEVFKLPEPVTVITKIDGLANHAELSMRILGDETFELTDWEAEFLTSIARRHHLSDKQQLYLKKIAGRYTFAKQHNGWSDV